MNSLEHSKTTIKDIFVYLGIFITLTVSVTNLIQIVFTAIDKKFVDVFSDVYTYDIYNDSVRFAVATLCVLFPLYVLLSWIASADISKFLYKRDLLIRRVMIYGTLFVTVCTLIGTLITIIYTFLGGELTIRFGMKALAIASIAGVVFGYYWYALRRNYAVKTTLPMIITAIVSALVVFAVVWSITLIGTPQEMRLRKLDSKRLSDLSSIQSQIYSNFQNTEKLPESLSELTNALQGYSLPSDPETKESYDYKMIQAPVIRMNYTTQKRELATPAIFELCATFVTERALDETGKIIEGTNTSYSADRFYYEGDTSAFWNHKVGVTCFKRVINAQMYSPK